MALVKTTCASASISCRLATVVTAVAVPGATVVAPVGAAVVVDPPPPAAAVVVTPAAVDVVAPESPWVAADQGRWHPLHADDRYFFAGS